jgi:hypothetical protein
VLCFALLSGYRQSFDYIFYITHTDPKLSITKAIKPVNTAHEYSDEHKSPTDKKIRKKNAVLLNTAAVASIVMAHRNTPPQNILDIVCITMRSPS